MVRLQRVTFLALHNYLGLTTELFNPVRTVLCLFYYLCYLLDISLTHTQPYLQKCPEYKPHADKNLCINLTHVLTSV